ncbi:MAG: DUF11 domain-containing protein [Anaerolineae bacterium]
MARRVPLSLTKAFSPNPIGAGGTSTLTFTLSNTNTIALTGVGFSDTLPTGMTISAAASTTCGGTLTATVGTGVVSLASGTIPGSGSCTVTVPVTSSTAGPSTNISGFITSTEAGQNNTASGSASATLIVLSPPQISKLFAQNPIQVGGTSTLTFTITNPNQNNAISSVAFTDTFPLAPGSMVVASPPGSTNTCGGTFAPVAGAGSVSLSGGTIAAGASCTLSVNVTAPATGSYVNTSGSVSHIVNGTTFSGNTATSTLTVNPAHPSISVLKQVGPTNTGPWSSYMSVVTGGSVYYLITVENTGDVPLSPVTVSDPNVSTASCVWPNPLPVAVAANNNHIATCVIGAVSAVSGVHPNTVTANGVFGGTTYSDTSTATYATAALTLDKTANPLIFNALGQVINYSFTVTNTGSATLSGPVIIDDNLAADESCPLLTTIGDLDSFFDPGESIICTATYTITAADMTSGVVTNTATASSGGVTSPADTATVNRILADLSLSKSVDNPAPTVGSNIVYTLTVSNAGPSSATGVAVLDQLPAGLTFVSANPSQGSYNNVSGVWTVGTIAAAGNATLQITATVTLPGAITNSAEVSAATEPDPDSTPNNGVGNTEDDRADVSIQQGVADLSLTKMVSNSTPNVGTNVTFTITVSNAGPGNATNVTALDQLPAGYTFVSATPSQGSYNNVSGVWTVGTVNAAASATLQITATVNPTGSYANTAQITASDQADPDSTPNNNTTGEDDQQTNTPIPVQVADLSLSKTVSNPTPNVGTNVTFTLTLLNSGPSNATNVTVLDQLPAGYTFVSATPSQGAYNQLTGVWTVGTLNASASVTLQITATVNPTGPYANTAQVNFSDQTDPDSTPGNSTAGEDDQATATPIPVGVADLSLTKTASNPAPNVGSNEVFTITVNNAGPSSATNVTVLDQLPLGYTFVSATASQGSYDDATGIWGVGTVTAGGSATLQITATVNAAGPYANTAQVNFSDQTDPDSTPGNSTAGEDDQSSDTPVPVPVADLSLSKTVNNPNPTVGTNIIYTLTVSNTGPSAATNVAVTDNLPAGVTFSAATPSQGSYNSVSGVWTVGTINAGANATLQITVTVNVPGAMTNTAQVTASDQLDSDSTINNGVGNGEDDQASVTTPQGVADLSLTKTVTNATPNVGSSVTFTLTLTNTGPDSATNVSVLDQLPAGFTFTSAVASQGTYSSLTGVWLVGTLPAASSATLQLTVTVNVTGPYSNTAQVSASDEADPDSTPNNNTTGEDDQATSAVTPVAVADLSLTKSVSNPNPTVGTNVDYTLTISNAGPSDATNVIVTDQLPAAVTYMSSVPSQGTYNNLTGIWSVGTLNAGANATLQITVTINAVGAITNSAQVTASDQLDSDSTINNGIGNGEDDQSSVTTPQGVADLSLTKTVSNASPNVGSSVTFTLTLSSAGPDNATNVAVQDLLPAGYTFASATASLGTYNSGTGVWAVGTLNNGANATLQITAIVNAAGPYTNTAQVSASDEGDPDSTPNNSVVGEDDQASVAPTPIDVVDLSLSKSVNNPNPTVGGNFIYTITVSNGGPSTATNVTALDQLPAGVTFVSATTSQGAYVNATGVWTIGTIAAGANATLQITVSLNAVGAITNGAQVTFVDQTDSDSAPNNGVGNSEDDQASVTTPQGVSDISLSKNASTLTPSIGGPITFSITVTNAGPDNATNIAVNDQLPSGYTFVSYTATQGTYNPLSGAWLVGTLNTATNATLQIVGTVNAAGVYNNTAQLQSVDQFDPDSIPNNSTPGEDDQSLVIVSPVAGGTPPPPVPTSAAVAPALLIVDPVITKSVTPPFSQPGELVTWTITVQNPGSIPVTNVVTVDNMPPEVQIISVTSTMGTTSVSGQTVMLTLPVLNPGQSATITITTRVRANVVTPFTIINTASISNAENQTPRFAQAQLISAAHLPVTGESPWWQPVLLLLVGVSIFVVGTFVLRRVLRVCL